MKLKPKITIADHFAQMSDPRIDRTLRHKLIDILTIAICAVICRAESWVAIELYGCTKYSFLKTFFELPNGIPSHDTFARVFAQLNPQEFQSCFSNWMKSIQKITSSEVVAIEGKTLCGSSDKNSDSCAIQIVSAWATTNKLVLGQVKVDSKSNEITAMLENLSTEAQLSTAAEAFYQIADILKSLAESILQDVRAQNDTDGPIISTNIFAGLVRTTMQLDFDDLIEEVIPQTFRHMVHTILLKLLLALIQSQPLFTKRTSSQC